MVVLVVVIVCSVLPMLLSFIMVLGSFMVRMLIVVCMLVMVLRFFMVLVLPCCSDSSWCSRVVSMLVMVLRPHGAHVHRGSHARHGAQILHDAHVHRGPHARHGAQILHGVHAHRGLHARHGAQILHAHRGLHVRHDVQSLRLRGWPLLLLSLFNALSHRRARRREHAAPAKVT